MSLKKLALYSAALDMMRLANGLDVPISKPRIDIKTYGTNPKKCKSCVSFIWCKQSRNIRPKDNACSSYKCKKK